MNPYLAVGIMAGFVLLALSTSLSNVITTRGLALSVVASMVPLAAGWGIMWTLGAAVVGYVVGSLWARHGARKAAATTARCTRSSGNGSSEAADSVSSQCGIRSRQPGNGGGSGERGRGR